VSVPAVKPETLKVRFGHDPAFASVIFNPNSHVLAKAMFEMIDQLGEVDWYGHTTDATFVMLAG